MTGRFGGLVADALAGVARECPAAYDGMRAALGRRAIAVTVDGESFTLDLEASGSPVAPARGETPIGLETRAAALRDVLRGDLDLLDAILIDAVFVRGAAADLVALAEGCLFFLKGAVRSESMSPLFARLERLAAANHGENA